MKFNPGNIVKSRITDCVVRVTGPGKTEACEFSGIVLERGRGDYNPDHESTTWRNDFFNLAEPAPEPESLDPIFAHILEMRS